MTNVLMATPEEDCLGGPGGQGSLPGGGASELGLEGRTGILL